MLSNYDLALALAELEVDTADQPGNDTFGGRWKQVALAAEQIAGASSSANDSINGWMLRAAVALEVLSGTSGVEENRTRDGLLKRIVDALEVKAGAVYTGSLGYRFRTAALNAVYVALDLNFATMTALDSRVTFSRASSAMVYDSTGKLTFAPNNQVTNSAPAGWTLINGGTRNVVGDTAEITGNGTNFSGAEHGTGSVVGRYYIVAVDVKAGTAPVVGILIDGGNLNFWYTPATDTFNGVPGGVTVGSQVLADGFTRIFARYAATGGSHASGWFFPAATNATIVGSGMISLRYPQIEATTYETTPRTYNATTAAAYQGPRFDYNPSSLAARGLLIEEARTNLLLRSDAYDHAGWAKAGITVTANVAASPDGTTSAELLAPSTGNSYVHNAAGATVTAGVNYTFSVWMKSTGADRTLSIGIWDTGLSVAQGTTVCTVTSTWQRFTVTAGTGALISVFCLIGGGATFVTGEDIHVWGAQLELGAFATSYIPTVAATVTRAADSASMSNADLAAFYNNAAGTWVYQFDTQSSATVTTMAVGDGAGPSIYLGNDQASYFPLAGNNANFVPAKPAAGVLTKRAFAYAFNDAALSVDGGAVSTDATVDISNLSASGVFYIGTANGAASHINGHIKRLSYYASRKSNAELVALTT